MNQGDKIYANTPASGTPLGFNSLFDRLEALRQLHYTSANQLNASSLSNSINTSQAEEGKTITPTDVQALNTHLNTLKQSTWYVSNTSGSTTKLENQFTSQFEVPSVGTLIKASKFDELSNQITTLENICPVYSGKYSAQYSSFYTSFYTSQYSAQYSSFYGSFYSSQYGSFYSSFYGSFYSAQYGSRYSAQYSSRYSSDYGSRYSSDYGSRYSSDYGSRYSAEYSGRYSAAYSGAYSSFYTGRYSAAYSGAYSGFYTGRYSSDYGSRYSSFYASRGRN